MSDTPSQSPLRSMTGFASGTGAFDAFSYSWELRSVNGKGLDMRLRVPDWIDGLETGLRAMIAQVAKRGNITLTLRITREDAAGGLSVNAAQLASVLTGLKAIEAEAMAQGLDLAPSRAADIATMRGVLDQNVTETDTKPLCAALLKAAEDLVANFDRMRQTEGDALAAMLDRHLDDIGTLTRSAADQAAARQDEMAAALKRNLARVLDNADGVDADRLAQELAMIAVKSDVTEEIDRLHAHVDAARDLTRQGGPVGRKLDFLMQEFNREANTLCSKAQSTDLTRTGLALKALIDQMREQVQNVE